MRQRPTQAEIKDINAKLDAFEQYMHDCGLYSIEEMRPINETRMAARWKLGEACSGGTRSRSVDRYNFGLPAP